MNLDVPRDVARRVLPAPLKDWLREAMRRAALARSVRRLRKLPDDRPVGSGLLDRLRWGWGNESYTAPCEFLERIAERARNTGGPILECGSGCSTLLLGVVAGDRGVEVWSLEHDLEWLRAIEAQLGKFQVRGVRLVHAPLGAYDGFDWYRPAAGTSLPPRFTVVVCDGPPSATTRGGRYGLLPVLGDRLASGTEILLDDAARPEERAVVERWAAERPLRAEVDEGVGRGIAHLTLL